MTSTSFRVGRPRGRLATSLALLLLVLVPGAAIACSPPLSAGECENYEADLANDFTDIRRADDISVGPDLGDGGDTAMNFKGSTGSAGDLWMSLYNKGNGYQAVRLCVDVLTHPFNNRKGAGVFFLYNETKAGGLGLAAIVTNAGNTDQLLLGVANQATGAFTVLSGGTFSLGSAIAQDAWYRLRVEMSTYTGNGVSIELQVFRHTNPSDPNSPLFTQVGTDFYWNGGLPSGVQTSGAVGLVAYAKLAVVDSSATNFVRDYISPP
jgi:hypothetical protein